MERTLAVIKPNAAKHAEEIKERIRKAGFNIVVERSVTLSRAAAERFYAEHRRKQFYAALLDYVTAGPVLLMVLSKRRAISAWRHLIGPTNPTVAKDTRPDSLRAVYGSGESENGLHGSDSFLSAEREIRIFFPKLEGKRPADAARQYAVRETGFALTAACSQLYAMDEQPAEPLVRNIYIFSVYISTARRLHRLRRCAQLVLAEALAGHKRD